MKNSQNIKVFMRASLAAILMPAIVITLYAFVFNLVAVFAGSARNLEAGFLLAVLLIALIISLAHVLLLGLPAVWLLHRFRLLRWWSLTVAGFVGACIPMAIWSWPVDPPGMKSSYSYGNGSETIVAKVDGVPTLAGWIDYAQSVAFVGLFGVIAALAFWLVIRRRGLFADNPAT